MPTTLTPVWNPKDHPKDVARFKALADAAAEAFLDRVLTPDQLVEHAGDEFKALADALERTSLTYLETADERFYAGHEEAAFFIGLAIGRRLSARSV